MSKDFEVRSAIGNAVDAPAIVLKFWKVGDRFVHRIAVENHAGLVDAQLLSIEGNDTQDSPESPPVQDLSIEKRPSSTVALGVGMAGETIWSISFEAMLGTGRIVCDIACNPRGQMPDPRSMYQLQSGVGEPLAGQWELLDSIDSAVAQSGRRIGPLCVVPIVNSASPTQITTSGSILSICRDSLPEALDTRQNLRWGYEFQLS